MEAEGLTVLIAFIGIGVGLSYLGYIYYRITTDGWRLNRYDLAASITLLVLNLIHIGLGSTSVLRTMAMFALALGVVLQVIKWWLTKNVSPVEPTSKGGGDIEF